MYTIVCKNCTKEVARTPNLVCINCKVPKWGYTDDYLRGIGFSIPNLPPPVKVSVVSSEYTIFCKNHGGLVAKTPAKICPKCKAKNFGYSDVEIRQFFKPEKVIHQLPCRSCHTIVAKTPNCKCLVCTSHNWGYSQVEVDSDAFDPIQNGNKASTINYAIEAKRIKKVYAKGVVGLQEMTLRIPQGQFVAVMGPSGCGKSTLLKCLIGENPATHGTVKVFGKDLYENFNELKKSIGYVPQDDIVHRELTVHQSLYYAAKLRLPKSLTEHEIEEKITDVLQSLKIDSTNLAHNQKVDSQDLRNKKISELSGGQRKRVSIAVELLNDPNILFLDEPTSPLDPETIDEFLSSVKGLCQQKGTTIVMVTHKPEDLKYADALVFLGVQGYHTFYGSSDYKDICSYFGKESIIEVYALLGDADEIERVKKWYNRWYDNNGSADIRSKIPVLAQKSSGSLVRQFYWLSRRYARIKWSDKENLQLLMAQPLIIAGLVSFIFDRVQMSVLFLTAIAAIWFGVNNAAKEIVSELPIFRRERMYNLGLFPYILSKITILSIVAVVQVAVFITILYVRYRSSEISLVHIEHYVVNMFYLALSATLLGLALSAFFNTTEKVITVIPIFLMPQMMLAGVITKIDTQAKELLSYGMLGRWGTEIFATIQDRAKEVKGGEKGGMVGIFQPVPGPPGKQKWIQTEATKILDLYANELLGYFKGYWNNIAAISTLNVLMIILIVLFLKRYDSFKPKFFLKR
jgi:ABC-type multidrug transport system ATPase subunit